MGLIKLVLRSYFLLKYMYHSRKVRGHVYMHKRFKFSLCFYDFSINSWWGGFFGGVHLISCSLENFMFLVIIIISNYIINAFINTHDFDLVSHHGEVYVSSYNQIVVTYWRQQILYMHFSIYDIQKYHAKYRTIYFLEYSSFHNSTKYKIYFVIL